MPLDDFSGKRTILKFFTEMGNNEERASRAQGAQPQSTSAIDVRSRCYVANYVDVKGRGVAAAAAIIHFAGAVCGPPREWLREL